MADKNIPLQMPVQEITNSVPQAIQNYVNPPPPISPPNSFPIPTTIETLQPPQPKFDKEGHLISPVDLLGNPTKPNYTPGSPLDETSKLLGVSNILASQQPGSTDQNWADKDEKTNSETAGTIASTTPVQPSLEKQEQNQEEKIAQQRENLLQSQQDSTRKIQDIYQQGLDDAKQQQIINQYKDQLSDTERKVMQAKVHSDEQTSYNNLQQQWQEQKDKKVDPQHWFKEKGTAGTILAAIAVGLGQFGAMMPHTSGNGQNNALNIIQGAIDRDIDAQKDNINEGWKNLQFQGNEHDKLIAENHWKLNQFDQAKLLDYQKSKDLISDIKSSTSDQMQIQKLDQLNTEIDNKILDVRTDNLRRRLQVDMLDRQRAQAGTVDKKQIVNVAKEIYSNKDLQPPKGMSREEWAIRAATFMITGGKGNAPGGIMQSPGNQSGENADTALKEWNESFKIAANANPLGVMAGQVADSPAGGFFPTSLPGNQSSDSYKQNVDLGASMLKTFARLLQKDAHEQYHDQYAPLPWLPANDPRNVQRHDAFIKRIRAAIALKNSRNPGTSEDSGE